MMSIHEVLGDLAYLATDNRDKGDKFERLIKSYLQTDPLYQAQFSEVWLWSEWPDRPGPDTGIDLVARKRDGDGYTAIQCKFYEPAHTLQKGDIDSFFTASGKSPFKNRIIVSTTDKWSTHAEDALNNQLLPVIRIRAQDLDQSVIDWSEFSLDRPEDLVLKAKKKLRPHQQLALDKVATGFANSNRGQLIMACGTGKTFTSLKIAEQLVPQHGTVLFLVPSISLLSQTLREWTAEASIPLHSFAVCSDVSVGRNRKKDNEDARLHDLAFPATTKADALDHAVMNARTEDGLTVIFSTYQSIDVVAKAQQLGLPAFDLIVCDEAHRTTGVKAADAEESQFVRVHDNTAIKATKRLYMTATPRLYAEGSKVQAKEKEATLWSMDNPEVFGPEFHRLGFGEAVSAGLLTDYKVMVLAVDEKAVNRRFQSQLADSNNELTLDDAVKIIGCWNGLAKRTSTVVSYDVGQVDQAPMRRAVAFARSINDSKKISGMFGDLVDEYRATTPEDNLLRCEAKHVDGTFNVLSRNDRLDWLKEDTTSQGNVCRILSNARCLSEGVDVPALDAVMFLNSRDSVVDVVQSVGRVMRKSEGKDYGYIILPIGVPADVTPEIALSDNKKYQVVWQVLQALRAHDDRFDALVNKIELNRSKNDALQIIGVGGSPGDGEGDSGIAETRVLQKPLSFPNIEEWRSAIYAKIVQKVGTRRYWETWAKDVADIATRHINRITTLVETADTEHRAAFEEFLTSLRQNLNPSITQTDAIEMLSQHLITKPVFDALFENYEFSKHNPVSLAMQTMLDVLEGQSLEKETQTLDKFYESVRQRAGGIDNAEGKQRIIVELYDKFFKSAFPRTADRLGIVYTPIEVVDFILHSANDALQQEFGVSLSDKGVHILDPFTGTGTFMVRLLQNGLIRPEDLLRKYTEELHANEIVLLAYYIAAINIEATFHEVAGTTYQPFHGIVLTDTFQMTEGKGSFSGTRFPENNERVTRQNSTQIHVILGNPPYSVGQDSQNDDNQNMKYPLLDSSIRESYAARSTAGLKRNLYDSYIRAIRWASNRIEGRGIICYVTNGSFIETNSMDGLRKSLVDEFTTIYVFNLRGNQRTSGAHSHQEGGKIFGSGSRAPIAITLLLKNLNKPGECTIHYHDIGDFLDRKEKLTVIREMKSILTVPWVEITPNASHDWIEQRGEEFNQFIPMGDKENKSSESIFYIYSLGIVTNRDAWTYNFSKAQLAENISRMIAFYNSQVDQTANRNTKGLSDYQLASEQVLSNDPKSISWSRSLTVQMRKQLKHQFNASSLVPSMYRPYAKQWLYFDRSLNENVYRMPALFPAEGLDNQVICVTGVGASKSFSAMITDVIPNLHLHDTGQVFPRYFYEKTDFQDGQFPGISSSTAEGRYAQKSAITDSTVTKFSNAYELTISKDDIFYYVYGILHSPEYKQRFKSDLRKMLPRIPMAHDFWAFSNAGRNLAYWHLNYETVEPYPLEQSSGSLIPNPRVHKMRFDKRGKDVDRRTIIYNGKLKLSSIPLESYEYVVNGKSAIEWILDRYQYKREDDSQIVNDPNEWSDDPLYIINLVKRMVTVSLETMKIVHSLPALSERT